MATRALIREADLARVMRTAKKLGMEVRLEILPDRVIVTAGGASAAPDASNDLDARLEAFGSL